MSELRRALRPARGEQKALRGFTLLESVLVMAVLAVMAYIGATTLVHLAPKYRLRASAWGVYSRLHQARYKAVFDGAAVRVRFEETKYFLETYDAEAKAWLLDKACLLEGVTVRATNTPVFYPNGTVSNLASITVENSWGAFKLTLAITGRVKVVPV